jgi:hypothetical protein
MDAVILSLLLAILLLHLLIAGAMYMGARTIARQFSAALSSMDRRLDALGTAVGQLTNEAAGRLDALGTAVGQLTNEAAGRLDALGTTVGHVRRMVEATSEIASAFTQVSEQKLNRIQQGLTTANFALGGRGSPDDIVLGALEVGQLGAVNPEIGTYLGPDTDRIESEHRSDSVHLTESGLSKLAEMWADTLGKFLHSPCLELHHGAEG